MTQILHKVSPLGQVIYTGGFFFPNGNVAASRVLGIGEVLRAVGYSVVYVGAEVQGRKEDLQSDGIYRYRDFVYYSGGEGLNKATSPKSNILARYLSYGNNTMKWLNTRSEREIKAIILYNGLAINTIRLLLFCKKHRIPLIMDITEWPEDIITSNNKSSLYKWDIAITRRFLYKKAKNIIAISSFLENYYKKYAKVIRIPPLIDSEDPVWLPAYKPGTKLPLRVMYAGTPDKKDCIDVLLDAFWIIKQNGIPAILELIGIEIEKLKCLSSRIPEQIERLDNSLVIHGRLPTPSDAHRLLSHADLLILVKMPSRTADAQFPTKFVEYLALSKPLIVNITSDINDYITDGKEGFIVAVNDAPSIAETIQLAVHKREQLAQMGEASRVRAKASFDYRNYTADLAEFFRQLE